MIPRRTWAPEAYLTVRGTGSCSGTRTRPCDVPKKVAIEHGIAESGRRFGRDMPDAGHFLSSEEGLRFVVDNWATLKRCAKQKRVRRLLDGASSEEMDVVFHGNQGAIGKLKEGLMARFDLSDKNLASYLVQIMAAIEKQGANVFKRALLWAAHTKSKSLVDRWLAEFNATGLGLRAVRRKGKLVGGCPTESGTS